MTGTKVFIDKKPKLFGIKKYEALGRLTSFDWAYQLEIRSILWRLSSEREPLDQWPNLYQQLHEDIKENPILNIPDGYTSISAYQASNKILEITGEFSDLHQDYVAPLTLGFTFDAVKQLPEEIIDILEKENEKYLEYSGLPLDFYVYRYQGDIVREIQLTVDLDGSDENILGDFKKYLVAARTLYQTPKDGKITRNMIQRLSQNKILPFLDLSIWSKINDKKISYQNTAKWLFTHKLDDVNADKIRKVTRPLALRAIDPQFFRKLSSFPE